MNKYKFNITTIIIIFFVSDLIPNFSTQMCREKLLCRVQKFCDKSVRFDENPIIQFLSE